MSEHHVFTGSAGADRSSAFGWSHTVPDSVPVMGGDPARYVTSRPAADRWHGFAWFVMATVGLLFMAAVSKSALALLLSWLGYV